MRRFNHLVGSNERILGIIRRPPLSTPQRHAVGAIAGVVTLLAMLGTVQLLRLQSVRAAGDESARRLAATSPEVAYVRGVERELVGLRASRDRLAAIRRSGTLAANQIAALGNELPRDAWLTTVRVDGDTLDVEGRGRRLNSVGGTIAAWARLPRYADARLVAVHAEPAAGVTYAIALEPRR